MSTVECVAVIARQSIYSVIFATPCSTEYSRDAFMRWSNII